MNTYVQEITIVPMPGQKKRWVKVAFSDGGEWIPKLEELAIIAADIGICEDEKYGWQPGVVNNVKGAEMVVEYLTRAILEARTNEGVAQLSAEYQIPRREPTLQQLNDRVPLMRDPSGQ